MPKITFMGAGSTVFAKNVLGDSMMTPALEESTIALYDIDADRLKESRLMLDTINRNNGSKAKIESYLGVENRKAALKDANYVVNAIQVGGYEPCTVTDFEIPKKYGLRQTIADTLGIGGLRRYSTLKSSSPTMDMCCLNSSCISVKRDKSIASTIWRSAPIRAGALPAMTLNKTATMMSGSNLTMKCSKSPISPARAGT